MFPPTRAFPFLVLSAALGLASACGREEITSSRVPKEPDAQDPTAPGPATLGWTVPPDWKPLESSGMRFASFAVPAEGGKAELSVVVLPGPAGGDLANVNRWRGQIGLGPLDEEGLGRESQELRTAAGTLLWVEYTGKTGALAGAILSTGDSTWFFKLTGEGRIVAAAKPSLRRFLQSLRPGPPA